MLDVFRPLDENETWAQECVLHSKLFVMDMRRVSFRDNTRVSGRASAVAPGVWPEPFCLSAQEFQLLSFSRLQVCVKKPKAANVSPLVCRGKFSSLPGSRCNMIEEERKTEWWLGMISLLLEKWNSFYSLCIFVNEECPCDLDLKVNSEGRRVIWILQTWWKDEAVTHHHHHHHHQRGILTLLPPRSVDH